MATTYEVVLYGASGYTGKLTAWKLAERGIPFIAAGRNKARLEEEMAKVPELKGHDYRCVGVAHEKGALIELFSGKKAVINIVGPFMQLGRPVVEACLQAGTHYFDTTGETDWMTFLKREFGRAFAGKELVLCPGNSYMWAEGNLAMEIALETPGIDTLDATYLADSEVSVASTMSFLRMCVRPQYFIRNRELVQWPWATPYQVHVPGEHALLNALPWSGGGEPVWYEGDGRVRNCQVLVSFRNQERFNAVVGLLRKFDAECRQLDPARQEEVTNEWGKGITQVEPAREVPEVNRCTLCCQGRGNTNSVSVILRGNSPYAQTGVFGAEAVRRVLRRQLAAVGFASPARAFGARNLLAAQAEEGYLAYEVKSV